MGRRAKQVAEKRRLREPRPHMARVTVNDETWQHFRRLAEPSGGVSRKLGELVSREVRRHREHQLRAGTASAREALSALDEARELARQVGAIVDRLEAVAGASSHR
jgi:post-segregation antitoxin (ccd killing protein)